MMHGRLQPSFADLQILVKKKRLRPRAHAVACTLANWHESLAVLTKTTGDVQAINRNPVSQAAYRFIEKNLDGAVGGVLGTLPRDFRQPYAVAGTIDKLAGVVRRLQLNAPPNAIGMWPNALPVSLPDVLNGAWAFKLLQLEEAADWATPRNLDRVCRLTLKAIESSHFKAVFGPKLGQRGEDA